MIGLVSKTDRFHELSIKIFDKIKKNYIKNVYIPSSAYLEYELLLKSRNIDELEIIRDIVHFKNIKNIKEIPIDSSIIILASQLRDVYNLTYFDSLHCGSAIHKDGSIISSDKDFKKISNLVVIEPESLINGDDGIYSK